MKQLNTATKIFKSLISNDPTVINLNSMRQPLNLSSSKVHRVRPHLSGLRPVGLHSEAPSCWQRLLL